jgi:hypothetical protein
MVQELTLATQNPVVNCGTLARNWYMFSTTPKLIQQETTGDRKILADELEK